MYFQTRGVIFIYLFCFISRSSHASSCRELLIEGFRYSSVFSPTAPVAKHVIVYSSVLCYIHSCEPDQSFYLRACRPLPRSIQLLPAGATTDLGCDLYACANGQ